MKCIRCNSVMIYNKFYGPHDNFWGGKCVLCGEIVDEVILENRQLITMGQVPDSLVGLLQSKEIKEWNVEFD